MEEPEKINGKKKLPSIPANFVTLLQLQERWKKEKEGNQKGKEEIEEPQQGEEENEAKVEERVNDEVARRGSRKNRNFRRFNKEKDGKQNGKEEKEEPQLGDEENEAKVEERVNDEVARRGSRKIGNFRLLYKEKDGKQNGKIEKEESKQGQEQNEAKVEEPVNDEVARRGSRKNGKFLRRDWNNGKRFVEKKHEEEKIEISESEGVKKEKKSNESKEKKKKKRAKRKNHKQEEKARANNEGDEVNDLALKSPMPASVVKEMSGDEAHAVKLASVEATREWKPRIIPRTDDRTVGIGQKFGAMSLKGETRTGEHYRYGRGYGNFNHFGRNRERNRHYGQFDRSRELNQSNEGMVWVKKGEVSGGNVSGIQSSNGSSKELD